MGFFNSKEVRVLKNFPLKVRLAIFFCLLTLGSWSVSHSQISSGRTLFSVAGPELESAASTALRQRFVAVDASSLTAYENETAENPLLHPLILNLFPDTTFQATLKRFNRLGEDRFTWLGTLEGVPGSTATFAVRGAVLAGHLSLPGVSYEIRYQGNGLHSVSELNSAAFPEEKTPIPVNTGDVEEAPQYSEAPDGGSQIDVIVLYTPNARSAAGGTNSIEALIDLAVQNANTAYANSGVTQQVRLVYSGEIQYTESGTMSTDLSRLRNTSDGYMDDAHSLRDQYKADIVSLLTQTTSACGLAYLMTNTSVNFASSAFNVTAQTCAAGNLSLAHEMGHNMGLAHDPANSSTQGAYSYSYGHQDPGYFRTVMAYSCSVSCPRVMHFSNPNKTYNDRPTGIADSRDNARTLNNTAQTVANFRSSGTATGNPSLNITMSQTTYVNGDMVTINEINPKNPNSSPTAVRLRVWLKIPLVGDLTLIDIGSDGSFRLPANLDQSAGPISLFQITSSFPPKGKYEFNSRLTNPTSGALYSEDINTFSVQ